MSLGTPALQRSFVRLPHKLCLNTAMLFPLDCMPLKDRGQEQVRLEQLTQYLELNGTLVMMQEI